MIITITRAEGPIHLCDKSVSCSSFHEASMMLRRWADTAPKRGGYDKCDFTIRDDALGIDYRGRYDLKHWKVEVTDLKGHVLGYLAFISGHERPCHITPEQYQAVIAPYRNLAEQAWELHNILKELP